MDSVNAELCETSNTAKGSPLVGFPPAKPNDTAALISSSNRRPIHIIIMGPRLSRGTGLLLLLPPDAVHALAVALLDAARDAVHGPGDDLADAAPLHGVDPGRPGHAVPPDRVDQVVAVGGDPARELVLALEVGAGAHGREEQAPEHVADEDEANDGVLHGVGQEGPPAIRGAGDGHAGHLRRRPRVLREPRRRGQDLGRLAVVELVRTRPQVVGDGVNVGAALEPAVVQLVGGVGGQLGACGFFGVVLVKCVCVVRFRAITCQKKPR